MIEFIKKEYKHLLILFFILVASFALFWLKQANILVDVGREFYLPSQMNKGLVLYKDILNVYSPLSYQLNAILYKIFGENISTLYNFAILNAFAIIFGVYALAREFLDKNYSLLISVSMIALYVITAGSFNYCLPYTFAAPYAILSFLFSVFCLVKYVKNSDVKYFYLSAFFAGMSLDFKLEYVLYPFVLLYVGLFFKPVKKVELLNSIICLMLTPLLSILTLILQGASFGDLINAFEIMQKMAKAPSTQFFYKNYSGFIFNYGSILSNFRYLIMAIVMFAIIAIREKASHSENKINRYFAGIVSAIVVYLVFIYSYKNILFPLSIINFLLFLFCIKKLYENKPLFIMSLCAIVATFKSIFVFAVNTYGIFAAPFLFISCLGMFLYLFDSDEKLNIIAKSIKFNLKFVFIIYLAMIFYTNYNLNVHKIVLETPKGNIVVNRQVGALHRTLIDFLVNNTKPTDRVVILPETPFINFVIDRPTHNFYMCLIPVYTDVFGEQKIISDFKKDMPEYFVLNNRDCLEYGAQYFGLDFAKDIKAFIDSNYDFIKQIQAGNNVMLIYERKDIK